MTAHGENANGVLPDHRPETPTCRQAGCVERAAAPEGFCAGCKRVYEEMRLERERELASAARMLGLANPQWRETFADALPGQYELMLLHAAAHHLQRGGPMGEAVSFAALHDYLDETMDRIRGARGGKSS